MGGYSLTLVHTGYIVSPAQGDGLSGDPLRTLQLARGGTTRVLFPIQKRAAILDAFCTSSGS